VDDAAFSAVEPASPVHATLSALRARIAGDPGLAAGPGASVRAEVLPRRSRDGRLELERCYWSIQQPAPDAEFGFVGRTLYWDSRMPEPRVVEFPDEPVMDWLVTPDGALCSHGDQAGVNILRYIPLRRVTFRLERAVGLPPRVITKTKRRRSIVRAARALVAARRAVGRSDSTFRVPEPVRLDSQRRLLHQAELPGRALPELLAAGELDRLEAMHRLGRVHREVHELDVRRGRVRTRHNEEWLAITAAAAEQISALAPSAGERVDALVAALARTTPVDGDLAFCQGDFVPSQILCDGTSGWAVLDFDDAHHADPHAEVAALFVALGRELPHRTPADVAETRRAYLSGYVERAGRPLDPTRWWWFAAVAEVRYLARRLVKGRAIPGEATAVLDAVDAAADELPDVRP
jgi:aminoglycoside phosphotransferase